MGSASGATMQGRDIRHTLPVMRVRLVSGPDVRSNSDSAAYTPCGPPWDFYGKFDSHLKHEISIAKLTHCTHTHTHTRTPTHTHVENRKTRTKQEKRLKGNSSGTAELS